MDEHQLDTKIMDQLYQKLSKARQFQKEVLEDQGIEGEPNIIAKAKMSLDILNNEFLEDKYKIQHILSKVLKGSAKLEYDNEWRTFCVRNSQL